MSVDYKVCPRPRQKKKKGNKEKNYESPSQCLALQAHETVEQF